MSARDMLDATPPADLASKDRAIVRAAIAWAQAERSIEAANDAWNPLRLHESNMRLKHAIDAERNTRRTLMALCEGETT